ncbi:MAG: sulfur carrier protein ThiS [Planctomycetaceae bacterium]|nr:sulfur carrier protein ThiS [Planctomycetaceae bacterium]
MSSDESTIEITLNGASYELAAGTTVAELLIIRQLSVKFLAVERNRELVPRAQHAECLLVAGDEVEIVTLVGGG